MKKGFGERRWCENSVPVSLKPIRLLQLILDIMILFVSISIWENLVYGTTIVASVILTILFASFAIIIGIHAIGHIGGCKTPNLPMLLIAFAGLILFASAAQVIYLFVYHKVKDGQSGVIVLIALCLVAALLFLLDAMIMMMYKHWRSNCTRTGKCMRLLPSGPPAPLQPIEYADASTNVNFDKSRLDFLENENNNRRQYVDRSTYSDLKTQVTVVETQTQRVKSVERMDHETSAIAVVEEKKAQTLSPCPVCASALDYSPEGICPSFLALVKNFGMFSCTDSPPQIKPEPVVLVEKGTVPGSSSSLESKESTLVIAKRPPRIYETRPCPTHGAGLIAQRAGLPSPVTRISVTHSIRKNKQSQTPASKPVIIKDKHQNTEINIAVTTNLQCSRGSQASEKNNNSTQEINIEPLRIEEAELKENVIEEKSPTPEGSFSGQEVLENLESPEIREGGGSLDTVSAGSSRITKIESKSNNRESLSPKFRSSFEKKDRMHYEKNLSQLKDNMTVRGNDKIYSTAISLGNSSAIAQVKNSISPQIIPDGSREFASPGLSSSCECSEYYYYKDVFGRCICGLCAPKYLIKVPQRSQTVGGMRCFSCYNPIFDRYPNVGKICRCRKCCRCRRQV